MCRKLAWFFLYEKPTHGDLEKIDRLLASACWLEMLKGLFILLILCLIGLLFGK